MQPVCVQGQVIGQLLKEKNTGEFMDGWLSTLKGSGLETVTSAGGSEDAMLFR